MALGEAGDRPGDRRGEERGLALLPQRAEDLVEVVGEAHVEHLVGLVEDDGLDLVEAERAAVEVVHRAPGRRDDHVHAAREAVELRGDRLPAVHRHDAHAELAAVPVDGLGHLHRELAGGREHERRRAAAAAVRGTPRPSTGRPASRSCVHAAGEALEDRQGEGGGLAGPGRRLGQQVAALEQRRDRGQLDGRGLLVAERGERAQQPRVEAEGGEACRPGSVGAGSGSAEVATGAASGASAGSGFSSFTRRG